MHEWVNQPAAAIDFQSADAARQRQNQLTKPPGSLGELENIAITFAGLQGREKPVLNRIEACVFAGDHGVVARGISAFPQEVTGQMIANFATGGAAVSVLAREQGAGLRVVNLGTAAPIPDVAGVIDLQLAPGTRDFTHEEAMTESVLDGALEAGRQQVPANADLFVVGEMGIGNTTSAAALLAAFVDADAGNVIGRGTGLDDDGLARKRVVVAEGLSRHRATIEQHGGAERVLTALRCLGGLEIAAMTGAYLAAAQQGVPIIVDGFISTVAALAACRINSGCRDWMLFGHRSAEAGHARVLAELNATPLLDLGMRLGEGSGAMAAIGLVRAALATHGGMATFADAGVSDNA